MRRSRWVIALIAFFAPLTACKSANTTLVPDAQAPNEDPGPPCKCDPVLEYGYTCPDGRSPISACSVDSDPRDPNTQAGGICCAIPNVQCGAVECWDGNTCDSRVPGFCTNDPSRDAGDCACLGDCTDGYTDGFGKPVCGPSYAGNVCECPTCQRDGGACAANGIDAGVLYTCYAADYAIGALTQSGAMPCVLDDAGIACCAK